MVEECTPSEYQNSNAKSSKQILDELQGDLLVSQLDSLQLFSKDSTKVSITYSKKFKELVFRITVKDVSLPVNDFELVDLKVSDELLSDFLSCK